jgi:FAD/FMN-containing dehydrogenase
MNSLFLRFLICSFIFLVSSETLDSSPTTIVNGKDFIQCLTTIFRNFTYISEVSYNPKNSSFNSLLNFSIQNLRFALLSTPKPAYIVTPIDESQIQATFSCSRVHGYQIRVRSGGHDFEGQSYTSKVPFIIIDLVKFRKIQIDAESGSAWVEAGATLGELYYRIAEKNRTYGFPGGMCGTVGVGGFIGGGGYGPLKRKYGLAADNVIDAIFLNKNGNIYIGRGSMGEDVFWAIRGGVASSFGIVLAWKLKVVRVPETVTVFSVQRTLEQNGTNILHHWQSVAPKVDRDLYIRVHLHASTRRGKRTMHFTFISLFLGGANKLVSLMKKSFPELGLTKKDCSEMSWGKATLFFSGNGGFPYGESLKILLDRTASPKLYLKAKSDFVKVPIPVKGLTEMWRRILELEDGAAEIQMSPYGGKMDEYAESALPFPHRAGNLYMMTIGVSWNANTTLTTQRQRLDWLRKLYSYIGLYVSKNPRAAYVNYNDLDLGVGTSYKEASKWGNRYFKNNFKRLVQIKTEIDPDNVFNHEQSIPTSAL